MCLIHAFFSNAGLDQKASNFAVVESVLITGIDQRKRHSLKKKIITDETETTLISVKILHHLDAYIN